MPSERQIAANRKNGAKGGPKTDAGKERSRMNSFKHGLTFLRYNGAINSKFFRSMDLLIRLRNAGCRMEKQVPAPTPQQAGAAEPAPKVQAAAASGAARAELSAADLPVSRCPKMGFLTVSHPVGPFRPSRRYLQTATLPTFRPSDLPIFRVRFSQPVAHGPDAEVWVP